MDAQRKPRGPTMGKQIVTAKFIQREPLVSHSSHFISDCSAVSEEYIWFLVFKNSVRR